MNFSKRSSLTALAATVALALATGCAPKSDAPQTAGANPPPAAMVVNPVTQYQFTPVTSESDLQETSAYGYLIAKAGPGFKEATFDHMGLAIEGKLSLNGFNYYHLYKTADVLTSLSTMLRASGLRNSRQRLCLLRE